MPIIVNPGQRVSGFEIRLRKRRVYSIRGQVQGMAAGASSLQIVIDPQNPTEGRRLLGPSLRSNGSFEFKSVPPGSYLLYAMRDAGGGRGLSQAIARVPVTVTDSDVAGIVIQDAVRVPMQILGKVKVEGVEGEYRNPFGGTVVLHHAEGFVYGFSSASPQADGTFKLEGVSQDKYFVSVSGLPEGTYLKRVIAGNSDVLESGLDLSQPQTIPELEIVLSTKAATLEGEVRDEKKPWPGAFVTLLPEPLRPDRSQRLLKSATSDQNGRFTLKGIAPGEYRLYAWEEPMPPLTELRPEDLKPYEADSLSIKLSEGAQERVQLKLAKPPTVANTFFAVSGLLSAGSFSVASPVQQQPDDLVQQLRQLPTPLPCCPPSTGGIDPIEQRRADLYLQLRQHGENAMPALARGLRDPDVHLRRNVALFLGLLGRGYPRVDIISCLPALITALQDDDPDVRGWSAQAIGSIGPQAVQAVPALIALLNNSNEGSRNSACIALGGIGPPAKDALPALRRALSDTSADVRKFARGAIERIEAGR